MPRATLFLYGAIFVSGLNAVAFLAALLVAYLAKDTGNLTLLIGAVVANFSTAVAFWLGSSADSQHKTDLLAGAIHVSPQPAAEPLRAGPLAEQPRP